MRADWLSDFCRREGLPSEYGSIVHTVHGPIADAIAGRLGTRATPLCVGVCGPQGSGKSTLAGSLGHLLGARGLSAIVLSLDDFYLTKAEREKLASKVHPLLATRGPPGTHDLPLCSAVFDALDLGVPVALPRFSKGKDDRDPVAQWPTINHAVDVILFEGWCVGAKAECDSAVLEPINDLERTEDPDGIWRLWVNHQLASSYATLFSRIDLSILLRPPGFEAVFAMRREQERKLRERTVQEGEAARGVMNDSQLQRFIQHYERVTRNILKEMPQRADFIIDVQPFGTEGTLPRRDL